MTSLAAYVPLPEGDAQFPLEFIENRGAIKLRETEEAITVGLIDVDDGTLKSEIAFFLPKRLDFVGITRQDLSEHLTGHFLDSRSTKTVSDDRTRLDQLAHDAPVVNLVNHIFLEGIRRNCSDIHIESHPDGARVRYRVDGVLLLGRTLPKDMMPGVSSRIKVMSNLNIVERRLPQDGRLSVTTGGRSVEFRVSIVPLAEGESIVMRLFQRQESGPGLPGLGLSDTFLSDLRRAGKSPNGLILVTGPTGSGKTTTLNALVQELSRDDNKVITIEDPVENVLSGVNQIQTNEAIGLTFDTVLRRLLRQDPDILMVGEIRDRKTAELSVRSALTGHLVLSTLHTNDALAAIPRLENMGVEPFLLAAVLRACSAQRLVRILCEVCKVEAPLTPVQTARYPGLSRAWAAKGCEACGKTGYKGRTVIGEIYVMDEVTEEMIASGKKRRDFAAHYQNLGAVSLRADGLERVSRGVTSLEELERVVAG